MGLFKRKAKPSSTHPSPIPPPAPTFSTAPIVPTIPPAEERVEPVRIPLRVIVDPIAAGNASAGGLFYINVDPKDDVSAIRRAISNKLGDVSMGIFKVSIPSQVRGEAREYVERWETDVNLIASFPSYNLDDPNQLVASLGPTGWTCDQTRLESPKIGDWWPNALAKRSELIAVLVRIDEEAAPDNIPFTFLTHFAPPDPPRSARPSSSSAPIKAPRRLPVVVDICPSNTVRQLKASILEADGRPVICLDSVVLWKVEMSEEEMIVIGERGGLKGGRMPWPYPPTAPVPVALSDSNLPISHYFQDSLSNGRMINISIWIHPSAAEKLARPNKLEGEEVAEAPLFTYPRVVQTRSTTVPQREREVSLPKSEISTSIDSIPVVPLPLNTYPAGRKGRGRARPSTAPAICPSADGEPLPQVHAFGSRSTSTATRVPSPLSFQSSSASSAQGLGLPPSFGNTTSTLPANKYRSDSEASGDSIPSLSFSDHSASTPEMEAQSVTTPEAEKADWLAPQVDEHGRNVKFFGSKASSLGPYWHKAIRVAA